MKYTFILFTLLFLTTNVHASKARMSALGQDSSMGSFYLEDSRSVFRNPGMISSLSDYVIVEASDSGTPDAGEGNILVGHGEGAEGGFFERVGENLAIGVYLGNALNNNSSKVGTTATGYAKDLGGTTAYSAPTTTLSSANENLNLFVGGEAGIKWGIRVSHASADSSTPADNTLPIYEKKHGLLGIGVGASIKNSDVYLNMDIKDEYEGGTVTTAAAHEKKDKVEADWMNIGAKHQVNDFSIFVDYDKKSIEATTGAATSIKDESEKSVIIIGAGFVQEVKSNSRMNVDLSFKKTSAKDTNGDSTVTDDNKIEVKRSELPLVVGFEMDANSWLSLRASAKQNILISKSKESGNTSTANTDLNTESTINGDTTVTIGMSLKFDSLEIDGTLGTTEGGLVDSRNVAGQVGVAYFF